MNRSLKQRESILGWTLILPSVVIILSLILYPIVSNVISSLFKVSLVEKDTFVGLANYRDVISDIDFWKAAFITVVYVIATTLGTALV